MRKILVSALALVFAAAPAMAQDLEKSIEVSVREQFQMVGDLGSTLDNGTTKTTEDADVYFRNRRMRFGASATYGILSVDFVVSADGDLGTASVGVDTAKATLNFMDEVYLSMGRVTMPTRGNDQSSSAMMGTSYFLTGSNLNDMGVKLGGAVAGGIFEYALTLTNGYQPYLENSNYANSTVTNLIGPAVGVQLRFNLLGGESTGGKDYFLGEKSAMTLGFSFVYQQLPENQKYYKFKGTTADQQNDIFFDVFLQGDVALGDNSLPFMLVYEHFGFNPTSGKTYELGGKLGKLQDPSIRPMGTLTAGVGFYAGALKIMPAVRYSVDLFQNDKDNSGYDSVVAHNLEVSLGYFPYGNNLNLKIGYLFKSENAKLTSGTKQSFVDHKLITQVDMAI